MELFRDWPGSKKPCKSYRFGGKIEQSMLFAHFAKEHAQQIEKLRNSQRGDGLDGGMQVLPGAAWDRSDMKMAQQMDAQ